MGNTLHKARLSMQNTGLARTVQRALQRTISAELFDTNSLIALELDFADFHPPPTDGQWPHRWADESDLEFLTQGGLSAAEVRAFFVQGARAALCTQGDKLVGYTWYLSSPCTVFGWIRVDFEQRLYGAAAYVAPEFRGRRLHAETRNFAYPALAALGHTGIVSFIEHLNRSSMRTGKDSPRRYTGRLTYMRLLGLVVYRLDGKWGAGFYNRRRPFDLSFDAFDRQNFRLKHKHATSGLGPR